MMAFLISALVFFMLVTLIVGVWWARQPGRMVQDRLSGRASATDAWDVQVLKPDQARQFGVADWLARLLEQAGYTWTLQQLVAVITGFAAVGAVIGMVRVGGGFWMLVAAAAAGFLPVVFLMYRRQQRMTLFQTQFPDAMDMMTRAIRAGHAL